jgi:hypothetical protein
MFVCCVCLCYRVHVSAARWSLVQEGSYRMWRVVVCDHETSLNEEAIARAGLQSQR